MIFLVLKTNPSHLWTVIVDQLKKGVHSDDFRLPGGATLHHLLLNGDLVINRRAVGADLHPSGEMQVG